MIRIRRIEINPNRINVVDIRVGSEVLRVGMSGDGLDCIWIKEDTLNPVRTSTLRCFNTGDEVSDSKELSFLGTYIKGVFEWHLFEVIDPDQVETLAWHI